MALFKPNRERRKKKALQAAMATLDAEDVESLALQKFDKDTVKRLAEQYKIPVMYGGSGADPDADAWSYRSIGSLRRMAALDRRLTDLEQEEIQRVGHWLWVTDPTIGGAVEMIVDYVIGTGFEIQAENDKVQAELEWHWYHPKNNWQLYQRDRLRDLLVFGEQFYPAARGKGTGRVGIGYLDPYSIEAVATDPDDVSFPIQVLRKSEPGRSGGYMIDTYNIVHHNPVERDAMLDVENPIFYFSLNRLMASSRGFSPLLRVADWAGAYDRLIFMLAENQASADEFTWDITFEGATQEECQKYLNSLDKSRGSGSMRCHNEKVKWEAKAPNLQGYERSAIAKVIFSKILSGMYRIPSSWLSGQVEDANRAAMLAQKDPTTMGLIALQTYYRHVVESILSFHLHSVYNTSESILEGVKEEELGFKVIPPSINVENEKEIAETTEKWANSLLVAEQQKWVNKKTAAQIFTHVAGRVGQEVDIHEDLQEKQQESDGNGKVNEAVRNLVKHGVKV